jgi:hypothetical protein
MKEDCNYDKTKLIHELSALKHFIRKHAIDDAKKANHPLCAKMYEEVSAEIEKSIEKLKAAVTGLAREGKYN